MLGIVTLAMLVAAAAFISPGMIFAQSNPSTVGSPGNPSNPATVGSPGNPPNSSTVGNDGVFYLQNPLNSKFNNVGSLVSGFVDIFTYLVVLFAALMIVYIGFRFVLARGNSKEISDLKNQLLWLVVGLAIVIGARIIIAVVINTLNSTGVVDPSVINSANNALNGHSTP